ncbi:hypothetical protein FG05_30725, partial [Fusarium graminearum]
KTFVVSENCHPQTISVLQSRAEGFNIKLVIGDVLADNSKLVREVEGDLIGTLIQYPDTHGGVHDYQALADIVHEKKALLSASTDLLALTMLKPPGDFGADIAIGNSQRFGVPLGYGGPHAAFFATSEKYKRKIPGRLALLANMSAFYAVYHGPKGLKTIAEDIWSKTRLAQSLILEKGEFKLHTEGLREDGSVLFDTVTLKGSPEAIAKVH